MKLGLKVLASSVSLVALHTYADNHSWITVVDLRDCLYSVTISSSDTGMKNRIESVACKEGSEDTYFQIGCAEYTFAPGSVTNVMYGVPYAKHGGDIKVKVHKPTLEDRKNYEGYVLQDNQKESGFTMWANILGNGSGAFTKRGVYKLKFDSRGTPSFVYLRD